MSDKRVLNPKSREQVFALFEQGIQDVHDVVDRFDGKYTANQIGGMLTIWRRLKAGTMTLSRRPHGRPLRAPAAPAPQAGAPGPSAPSAASASAAAPPQPGSEPFDFGASPGAASAGLGFGQPLVEYHVKRVGPTMIGFLGVEGDPINEDILGRKYGGGAYEVAKYQNGNRYGFPVRVMISEGTYGPPKNPRSALLPYPRLRAGEDDADPRLDRPRHAGPGELNETVQAFKAINEIVKENKEPPKPEGVESKVVDRAFDVLSRASQPAAAPQGGADLIVTFYQHQEAKREAEAREERGRWEREQQARDAEWKRQQAAEDTRRAADVAEMRQRHEQEMARIRQEASEREKAAAEQRAFIEKLDKERETRLNKSIEETQAQIAAVQASVAEEAKKEREHQRELAKAKEESLKIERERLREEMRLQKESNDRLYEFQKTTNQQMYELQMKAAGAGNDKGTEMVVGVVKDALQKADARAHEIAEVKKLEKLIQTVGPENAKTLAMQLMAGGAIDLKGVLPGGKGAAAAAGAAAQDGKDGQNGAAAAPQGGLMNGIAQQTIETPFFRDLVEIWGNHLRKRNSPVLFADVMARYMIEDGRVQLFYNWMAGEDWPDLLKAIRGKIRADQMQHFDAPEAEAFFNALIGIIARRTERDYVQGGIVPTAPAQDARRQETTEAAPAP